MTESCGSSRNGLGMDCWTAGLLDCRTVGILFFSAAGEKRRSPGKQLGCLPFQGAM